MSEDDSALHQKAKSRINWQCGTKGQAGSFFQNMFQIKCVVNMGLNPKEKKYIV